MNRLETWLDRLGLGRYAEILADNDVDFETLAHLTDADLKELGLSLGHRRKLLAALAEETQKPAEIAPDPIATGERRQEEATDRGAEHRQLTVMFCDLVGSTALSEALAPEELRDTIGCYHDAVASAVIDNGGHVAKLLGDGVLAYFGWPRAQENAAERAIRAGLAAVRAVAAMRVGGEQLAARVGIATGPVIVGDTAGKQTAEQGAVVGTTPNLAARLQAEAAPGEIVTHAATRRLVGSAFEFEDIGEHPLKGFADPVNLWRVIRMGRRDSRFEVLRGRSLTSFVGRQRELELLEDRWQRALEGEGQVILLSGEAGIGKSRIVRETTGRLQSEDCTILRCQCSPYDVNAAFAPLATEIETTAGMLPEDPPERRLDKLDAHLQELLGGIDEAGPLFAALLALPTDRYPPLEMAAQRRKQRTLSLLAERLARIAEIRPAVLLVEDVHWIDPSSLEALDAMVARLEVLPVLAVITTRPEFPPRWSEYGHVTAHSLSRLGRRDGRQIAQHIAGAKALPEELLDRLVAQTDGIPLFVEELTKTVLEANVLEEREDRFELTGSLPALAMPSTLQDSLMARLDRLAPVKRVIQAAACIGREFDAELLAAAMPIGREELDDAIEQLIDAQLIFRRSGVDGASYIFKHALVQDAAYGSLLTNTRRHVHGQLAAALAKREKPDRLALARHRAGAAQHSEAATLYLTAGRLSLESSALPEAVGALELGLSEAEALPPSTERDKLELDLRIALGTARMASSGWAHPSVAKAFEPAFPLARQFGEPDAYVSILWGLWVHYQTRTDFRRAHAWLDELKTVARENANSELPAVYEMSAGCQCFWEADHARAIAHTDHLREIYEPSRHARLTALTNHDPLVFAQHWAGSLADWIRGYPERSVARMDEAIDHARRIGHPFNLVFALTAGATSLIYLEELDRLLSHCDEAERVAAEEALGPFSERVTIMQWRGGALVMRGEHQRGHSLLKQGNDFWHESGGRICNAMFRSWISLGLSGLGRHEEASRLNTRNVDHCRSTGDRYMEPECIRLQGEFVLAAAKPDRDAAERYFREAVAVACSHGAKSWELRAATSLARLLQTRERGAEAIACLEPVVDWFSEGLDTTDLRRAKDVLSAI